MFFFFGFDQCRTMSRHFINYRTNRILTHGNIILYRGTHDAQAIQCGRRIHVRTLGSPIFMWAQSLFPIEGLWHTSIPSFFANPYKYTPSHTSLLLSLIVGLNNFTKLNPRAMKHPLFYVLAIFVAAALIIPLMTMSAVRISKYRAPSYAWFLVLCA